MQLTKGLKESCLSFYEKTKRMNDVLIQLSKTQELEISSPMQVENEFNEKIQGIIKSLRTEVDKKKVQKRGRSKAKLKKYESSHMSVKKENRRPMTSTAAQPKRIKNSRIKSNITKLTAKKKVVVKKPDKSLNKSNYISREGQQRRIQSAYNGYTKPRKFRIRKRQGSVIQKPYSHYEKKFTDSKIKDRTKEKEQNWKQLVNQESLI